MISKIYSNLPSFKNIDLHAGLNILVADKAENSNDKQTRNSAGKTSFLEVCHFALAAKCGKDSIFRSQELIEYNFGIEFDINGSKVTIQRTGAEPAKIQIVNHSIDLEINPEDDESFDFPVISNTDWQNLLGYKFFKLPKDKKSREASGYPTFRALISYFARRLDDQDFDSPSAYYKKQTTGDTQLAISYLLGLDWTISSDLEGVREKEKTLEELQKMVKDNSFPELFGNAGEIRAQVGILEHKLERLNRSIEAFNVHEQYGELEQEAATLTQNISSLSEENLLDIRAIEKLESEMAYEDDVSISAIDRLYEEAGIILPGMTLKNIKEVQTFHKSVVHNRQMHLSNEVKRYQNLVLNRDQVVQSLATRRAEVMRILRSHGALDQYLKLNEDIAKAEGELKFLKEKLSTAESLELGNTSLEKDRLLLKERMQIDLKERENSVKQASVAFSKYTSLLYEHPGTLSIDATDNGPSFKTRIDGARGKGIKNMVIFCFDMMIMEVMHSRGMGPGFLIHDSHLFDGVDDRQVAKALIAGAQASEEFGFQYIVTFNSNDLPRSELGDFPIDKYILPVKLTDAEETGGLFGLRF